MPTVADVDAELGEPDVEDAVPVLVPALLVVRRLVKVADARHVHLPLLAQDHRRGAAGPAVAGAVDDDGGVPQGFEVLGVALQDAADDDELVLRGQLEAQLRRRPRLGVLGKLAPSFFSSAERERHVPALLRAEDLRLGRGRDFGGFRDARVESAELLVEGRRRRLDDRVLRERDAHDARRAQLLGTGLEPPGAEAEPRRRRERGRLGREREGLDWSSAVDAVEDSLGLAEGGRGQVGLFWEGKRVFFFGRWKKTKEEVEAKLGSVFFYPRPSSFFPSPTLSHAHLEHFLERVVAG